MSNKQEAESVSGALKLPTLSITTGVEDDRVKSEEAASSLLHLLQTNQTSKKSMAVTPQHTVAKSTKQSPKKRKATAQKGKTDAQKSLKKAPQSWVLQGWRSWSHEEEVFLIGAVMERFFHRGSLSSTKKHKNETENCWTKIKNMYDFAWKKYSKKTRKHAPACRSENALARHYKVMKEKIMHNKIGCDFRSYYEEWENNFNAANDLIFKSQSNGSGKETSASASAPVAQTGESFWDLPKSRWSYEEEIFLIAAVLERFFQRGSLASSRGDSGDSECWTSIKRSYDLIRAKYAEKHGKKYTVKRSAPALARHFKVMKVRFTDTEGKQENLKTYYNDWKKKYNINNSLLPRNLVKPKANTETSEKSQNGACKKTVTGNDMKGKDEVSVKLEIDQKDAQANKQNVAAQNIQNAQGLQNSQGLNYWIGANPVVANAAGFQNNLQLANLWALQNANVGNGALPQLQTSGLPQNQSQLLNLWSIVYGGPNSSGSKVPTTS